MRTSSTVSNQVVRVVVTLVIAVVGFLILLAVAQQHFYLFKRVEPGQIGVMVRGGQIARVVPPGLYTDFGLFVSLETYSVEAYQFSVQDQELITSDNQRIGVTASGSVFRPNFTKADQIANLW